MPGIVKCALRGAAGFGAGAALFGAVLLAETHLARGSGKEGPPGFMFPLMVVSFSASGAIGITVLTWGLTDRASTIRAACGFAGGFLLTFFGALFTSISLQGGGRPEYLWGAAGFGASFALGAGIGTLFLQPSLAVPGALAFGIPGAGGGALLFYASGLTGFDKPEGYKAIAMICGTAGAFLPFVAGGALLGVMVSMSQRD